MTRSTPTIRNITLIVHEEQHTSEIVVGSEQWFAWLKTATAFSFSSRDGSYTARKERVGNQRGGWYWKAYRRHQGTLYHAYLGKPEHLTLARLREVALSLSARYGQAKTIQNTSKEEHRLYDQKPINTIMPLLETKLHPPQLPALLVDRVRLLTRLNAVFTHKLTLLQAPAGSGKTTLVNQWLAAQNTPSAISGRVAWVSLDSGDNDPIRFWRYVITALQTLPGQEAAVPGQDALALLTSTPIHPTFEQLPMDLVLTHLLNDLSRLPADGLLVLDDYHGITEPRICETLAFFIDHLPKTMRLLLLSRSEPSLPLLRWRARGEVCELRTADLRFSSEETAAFLRQTLPNPLSEAAFARLDASLEGWIAGLRLLSLTLSQLRTPQAVEQALLSLNEHAGLSAPYRSLLDYFVTEIVETQPEPLQRFLLQTSVLNRLCGPLCDAVTGCEESAAQLEEVKRAGLFLETLEGPGGWYRYHALFAEAMHREAGRRLGEVALRTLSLRASFWYEQEGLLPEAIEAARLAQDMERMARLIEQIDLSSFYEPGTMLRWLELFPETVLRVHPLLCHIFAVELRFPVELRFAQATAEMANASMSEEKRLRVERLLQWSDDGWQQRGMSSWPGITWGFRVLSALLDQEPFSSLVSYSQQALALLPQEKTQNFYLQMYRSTSRLYTGIEKLRMGQIGEARQLFSQAQEDNVGNNRHLAIEIDMMLGKSHFIQGDLRQAKRYYGRALAESRQIDDGEIAADALLELAWLAFEWNDLKGAEQRANEALELAYRTAPWFQEFSDRATLQFALLQHVRGETATALEQLMALASIPSPAWTPRGFWLSGRVRNWLGRLRMATGDIQGVQDSLQRQSQSDEDVSITERLGAQLLQGRLWLAQGKIEVALDLFAHLLPIAQQHLHQYTALEIQLLLALAHDAGKQEQQAHYWLRQALQQTVREGSIRLFLNEGRPMTLLLCSLLPTIQHDTTLYAYAQTILRRAPQNTFAATLSSDGRAIAPFELLTMQEQRVLRLLATGQTNQDIARELVVSINTVKYHLKHLYQKLGVSNRMQAREVARRFGSGELL